MLGCYVGTHFPEERKKCSYGCEAHHITDTGRRQSHYDTIPLCFDHHNQQTRLGFGESVHNGKKTFQAKYGTQEEMLKWTKEQLE